MESDDIDEIKKQLLKTQSINRHLLSDIGAINKTIKLLLVAGHLDQDWLDKAKELAGEL